MLSQKILGSEIFDGDFQMRIKQGLNDRESEWIYGQKQGFFASLVDVVSIRTLNFHQQLTLLHINGPSHIK